MRRNTVNLSNVDTLLVRMYKGKEYAEDRLHRMSSEDIVNEAIGRNLIEATGRKDEWGRKFYRLTPKGIKERNGR